MNIDRVEKNLNPSVLHIGMEWELYGVYKNSLDPVCCADMTQVYTYLSEALGWTIKGKRKEGMYWVQKEMEGVVMDLQDEVVRNMMELGTLTPVGDLNLLRKLFRLSLGDINEALETVGAVLWDQATSPQGDGFHPELTKKADFSLVRHYASVSRIEDLDRYTHTCAAQPNIDCPFEYLVPMLNALYVNTPSYWAQFANGTCRQNGKEYICGRAYWLVESSDKYGKHGFGIRPAFPDKPFENLQDFYHRMWQNIYPLLRRNGEILTPVDIGLSVHDYLLSPEGVEFIDRFGNISTPTLEVGDIVLQVSCGWIDVKPHIDLRDGYTLDEFLTSYREGELDAFFKKYQEWSWIEVRCCDMDYAEDGMKAGDFFYEVFKNHERFICESQSLDWNKSKEGFDQEIRLI